MIYLIGSLLPPKTVDASIPTLSQLSAELRDFENWYLLGLQLNISKNTLDSIEKLPNTKVRQCIEMIQHWINKCQNPQWGTVHEALRNIGESVLAAEIAEKYHVQSSRTSDEKSLAPGLEQASNPCNEEKPSMLTSAKQFTRTSDEISLVHVPR